MHNKIRPVDELLVDLLESSSIPVRELHTLPLPPRRVRTLRRLDIQIHHTLLLADRRVARVRKGARLPVAQTGQVVFIAAECRMRRRLDLVRAELVADHRPDHVVRLHGGECKNLSTDLSSLHYRRTSARTTSQWPGRRTSKKRRTSRQRTRFSAGAGGLSSTGTSPRAAPSTACPVKTCS